MRAENTSRNGTSNGSTPRKSTGNSTDAISPILNGSNPSYTNGTSKVHLQHRSPMYRGHNREELTRILIQGLVDMGYTSAASTLCNESGYELESVAVAAFRSSVLEGHWTEAEKILLGPLTPENDRSEGLILAEGADKEQMLFWLRQQKFLELLDDRDLGQALLVLRQELAPLNHDIQQLHVLSSLLMCPHEDLRAQAHWPETVEESRQQLLQDLTRCIAPSVMIRDHRLSELLDQVKEAQINQCLYHNTSIPPSLYADHMCNRADFPSKTWVQLDDHAGEVWHVRFSHDGSKLATASEDKTVIIYDTVNFHQIHRLLQHTQEVAFIAWSPDDTKLISCSKDGKARIWEVSTGRLLMDLDHGTPDSSCEITSASWLPDSSSFVTTSHDARAPICLWHLHGEKPRQPVHTWTSSDGRGLLRCVECAITPDGRRMVAVDTKSSMYIYNLQTYQEEYRRQLSSQSTSLAISQDSKTLLVNLTDCEIHMFDLDEGCMIRKFKGQKQGNFVIRSCFGGAADNFVLSGSEDGKVYIWHKENAALIETLRGHDRGVKHACVTTVAWNPKDPGMFASGGDDRRVRIWTTTPISNEATVATTGQHVRSEASRTSAVRSTHQRGDSNL